jgi:hypothetical protein
MNGYRRRDEEYDDDGRKTSEQQPLVKRPLTSGQFAWAISKKSGSYSVIDAIKNLRVADPVLSESEEE